MQINVRRIAILSAASTIVMAGQANGAQVPCPSISFRRVPVPASTHRAARPLGQQPHHRHTLKRGSNTTAAAVHPNLARPLPALAPTPVLASDVPPASGDQPAATPIVAYRLQRTVKMVACEVVPVVGSFRDDQLLPGAKPAAEVSFLPVSFAPPSQPLTFSTLPAIAPPWGGGGGGGGGYRPPTPPTVGLVPEPSTWAMLILGFFGLGARLRHSSRRTRSVNAGAAQGG